jgi:hypothetical protein
MRPDETRREQLRLEAERLKENEALQLAFDMARREALEALAAADAADVNAMLRLQAKVAAIDAIRAELDRIIIAAPKERRAVI